MSIGPSMPLRLEKPEGIDLAQAARYFGARGGADAATQALLEKCAVPLLAAATPRAVWLEADPDSLTAAGILAGEDVAKHLEGCTAALLLAVTLGPGVDAQIRRAGVGDIAAGVASDALGSALAEQAAKAAEAELRQWAARQGKYLTGRYSPGSTGHRPPRRALCHGKQPDDPPQEHHGHSGGQRSPGPGASGRMRALRAPHQVRI